MGIVKYLVISLCLAFAISPVFAQEEDPVQDNQLQLNRLISPEESEATWKLEAIGFSHNLKLSEEATTKVVREYKNSRLRLQETIQKAMTGGTGIRGNTALMLSQLMKKEQITLLENISPLLTETQLKHSMLTLGAFSHDWDWLVHTVSGFAFSRETTLVALSPIEVFIAGMSDSQYRSSGHVEMQQELQTLRDELLKSMSKLLDDEQIKIFREVAATVKIRNWQNASRSSLRKDTQRDSRSEPKKNPLPRKLNRYDANGDGKLTRQELPEFLHRLLDQLDANKDDMLDAEELKEIKDRFG